MFHIIYLVFIVLNLQNNTNMNSNVGLNTIMSTPRTLPLAEKLLLHVLRKLQPLELHLSVAVLKQWQFESHDFQSLHRASTNHKKG